MTLILAFDSTPVAIPGVTKLQAVIGYSAWVATALCLIGLIVTGALIVGAASPIAGSILGFNLFTSDPEAIPGLAGVQTVIGYVSWVAAAVCLIGLIISGAMLAVSHQRGTVDSTGRLGGVAAGCLIVGSASTIIGALI